MGAENETVASRLGGRLAPGAAAFRPAEPPERRLGADEFRALLDDGTAEDMADALLMLTEAGRRALAALLPRPGAPTAAGEAVLLVAGAACLPSADGVVAWLRSSRFHHEPTAGTAGHVVRVLSAPGRPHLATVASGLAKQLRSRTSWPVTEAILRAAGVPPPGTDAVARHWLRAYGKSPGSLPELLAADEWLDRMLPKIFTPPGGVVLDDRWPKALAALADDGRLPRDTLIRLALRRMADPDRPGSPRTAIACFRLLSPTPEELVQNHADPVRLIAAPSSSVAAVAQRALETLDEAGRLDPAAQEAATRAVLARTEKKLVRTHLAWLARSMARHPERSARLRGAMTEGLRSESAEIATLVRDALAGHAEPAPPAGAAAETATQPAEPAARPAPGHGPRGFSPRPPNAMPAPIASVADLVTEMAAVRADPWEPVALERLLAAVVSFARTDRADLIAVLTSFVGGRPSPLDVLLPLSRATSAPRAAPPQAMLLARIGEVAALLSSTGGAPVLLATPATVDGHVSPARVLFRLSEAERDGWQPGPHDLTQALLRLPRNVEPAVIEAAGRLTSPAGRRYFGWLRAGGLPDPLTTVGTVPGDHRFRRAVVDWSGLHGPDPALVQEWAGAPAGAPSGTAEPLAALLTTPPGHAPGPAGAPGAAVGGHRADGALPVPDMRCWPMVLPSHREIIAAHCLPYLCDESDRDGGGVGDVVARLVRSSGPFGAAMAAALARGLTAGRERDRQAAVEAVMRLARDGALGAALLGREIGQLLIADMARTVRAAGALAGVGQAGAWPVAWAIGRSLVPGLLRLDPPGPELAGLLAVVTEAAEVTGARADFAGLGALTVRAGDPRLKAEALRLARAAG